MITKQRSVGGSMVFTVPKPYRDTEANQYYDVTKREDGAIIYVPVTIVPGLK
jgi:hypothetical protein